METEKISDFVAGWDKYYTKILDNPNNYKEIPEQYKSEVHLVLMVLKLNPSLFGATPVEIKSNPWLCRVAVVLDPDNWRYVDEKCRKDPVFVLECISENAKVIGVVEDSVLSLDLKEKIEDMSSEHKFFLTKRLANI